jgi:tetratricopeptide (TPR) repeat protein
MARNPVVAKEKIAMVRATYLTRTALGMALALGIATGGMALPAAAKEKKPEAPKIQPSKAFIPAYVAAKDGLDKASKRQDVIDAQTTVKNADAAYRSASGKKARDEARGKYDASIAALGTLLQPEKDLLEKAFAVATTPDDKFIAGQLALGLGQLASDKSMQRRGLLSMVDSGKLSPADNAKFQFYIGGLSYDLKEYASARTSFQTAIAGGYTEGGIDGLLADAYFNDNMPNEGLKVLDDAITKRGAAAPEEWIRKGIIVAYKAKIPAQAIKFSTRLVENYPTKDNWALSLSVVRDVSNFQNQEQIDLLRLMARTGSFSEARDYIEYIQAADPRRLPAEALKIVNLGLAAGKLQMSDPFVADAKSMSTARIAEDKALLVTMERDVLKPGSTAANAMAAGDAFLSHDNAAKAEEMYKIALTKPGVDAPRALTRLGIVQSDQGRYAEAQATFAKVTGPRAAIAQLWSAYAKSKLAAPVAPAAK